MAPISSYGGNFGSDSNYWEVIRGPTRIAVQSAAAGIGPLLAHAMGVHAELRIGGEKTPSGWIVTASPLLDYERHLEGLSATLQPLPEHGSLATYWRHDFDVEPLGGRGELFAVHHRAPFEGITVFEPGSRRMSYLLPSDAPIYLPHVEHLIGCVFRAEGWAQGFVDVHAAFVRYRDKGLALIGPRRAGKTSLAMHLLGRGGALLGSDMAQIRIGGDGRIEAASIPHLTRITRETVWDNAALAGAIGARFDGNTDYLAGPLFAYGKYEMYDPGLELVLKRPVGLAAMPLDGIIFPHFDTGTTRASFTPAASDEGARRLVASIAHDRPLADWLPFDLSARAGAENVFATRILSGSPRLSAFDFWFGREPSMSGPDLDALIDMI